MIVSVKWWTVLCHVSVALSESATAGTSSESCAATDQIQQLIDAVARDPNPYSKQQEISSMAMKMKDSGHHAEAIPYLRAATFYEPWVESLWFHLADALFKESMRGINDAKMDETKMFRLGNLICESLAALELSAYLVNQPLEPLLEQTTKYGKIEFGSRPLDLQVDSMIRRISGIVKTQYPEHWSSSVSMSKYLQQRQAMALEHVDQHVEAVNLICHNSSSIRMELFEEDRQRGVPSAFYARDLFISMRVCGVVLLPDLYSMQTLAPVINAQRDLFEGWLARAEGSVHAESSSVAARNDMRYELMLPVEPPFTNEGFGDNKYLLWVSKLLMSNRFLIDTFSFVASLPGAPDGNWHADVSPLFTSFESALTEHLPPMGIVAIIPFVDMNSTSGPTEFIFGSHFLFQGNKGTATTSAKIEARVGDVVVFDIRLGHRGTSNQGKSTRSIAYISYTHRWFTDVVNFKSLQSKQWDKLGSSNRQRLYQRIDARQYAKDLEERFVEPELQSASAHRGDWTIL